MLRRKDTPEPGKAYQASHSFAFGHAVVRRGTVLTGDNPTVREHFQFFVEAGQPLPPVDDVRRPAGTR